MLSILEEFEKRKDEDPQKLLYAFLDLNGKIKESYTYQSFYQRTGIIASHIQKSHPFKTGDRILLAYAPGLEMICAFFSCIRLGLVPVPVYPPSGFGFEASVRKMWYIAEDCGAAAVLTDSSYFWSIQANIARKKNEPGFSGSERILNLKWILSDAANAAELIDFRQGHSDILFLQYTSGSTSHPKGVIVTHQNILNNCDNVVDHLPIGVSWLPQYHDMGLIGYYIFFALKGGTTYGFSAIDFIQRPALWLETISKYSATASSAPNFAYEYCLVPGNIPEETFLNLNLSSLRFLMTAAEPVNPVVYEAFILKFKDRGLDPKASFAAYGLAEFTLAVSNYGKVHHTFDQQALKENKVSISTATHPEQNSVALMSCGRPLGDTEIRIVDVSGVPKPAAPGNIGEIWLNGASKCAGYWNKPELSKEIFESKLSGESDNVGWLRTGDLGFLCEGELFVCGRVKDMIIIRGLNYYPQDIESVAEQHPEVRKGCVAAFAIEENGRENLIMIVGLKSNNKIPDARAMNKALVNDLGISASKIIFVPARTISKTSSGKIMRHQNKERFLANDLQVIPESGTFISEIPLTENLETTSLFNKYGLSGTENQSLGDSGLDSLKLAEFTHDLKSYVLQKGFKELSGELDLRLIQKIAVSELFQILDGNDGAGPLSALRLNNAFAKLQKAHEKAEMEMMRKDADCLVLPDNTSTPPPEKSKGHILLTGGTGFFGPFLLKSLLEQNKEEIYVLLRAENESEGYQRLHDSFSLTNPDPVLKNEFKNRIKPVCGDISKPNLGLGKTLWDFLAASVGTIYHNGAQVNYLLDYECMRSANINGTIEIVRLALSSRPKVLNHISTTFIFGWSVKDTLFESDENEKMENLDFGYSQSKWASEQIVKNAIKKGLRARIFRPALISPSVNGEGYNFDISIRLMAFMLKHGIGTSAKNQVSFSPADIAANNVVAISNIPESETLTFHVTRDDYSSMEDVTKILSELINKPFTNFPLTDFVPEVVGRCTKEDLLFPLLNFLVRSEKKISAMEFKRYDNTNYATFRDRSPWGKPDVSLREVVNGIYLFMKDQKIIETNTKAETYVRTN